MAPRKQASQLGIDRDYADIGWVESAEEAFELICDALGAQPRGDSVSARCPAHDDRRPSFNVALLERVHLDCKAGCTAQAINDALEALGVPRMAFYVERLGAYEPPTPQAVKAPTEKWVAACVDNGRSKMGGLAKKWRVPKEALIAAEFGWDGERWIIPVRDANGVLVDYRYGWLEGDKFVRRQRKDAPRRLYLPGGLGEGAVLLCEGESDALAALAAGANVVGVFGTAVVQDLEPLRGRDVVVAFDAGRRSRRGERDYLAALEGVARSARVHQWPEDAEEGYDVRDYLTDGGSIEALLASPAKFTFSFLPKGSISVREQPKPTTVFDPGCGALFYADKYHAVFGESGSGKSWVVQAAVADVLRRGGTALYLDYEDSQNAVLDRLAALGVTDSMVGRLAYVDAAGLTDGQMDEAVAAISTPFDITVIDGMTSSLNQYQKSGRDETDVTEWYRRLPRRIAGCVVSVDHVIKPGGERHNGGSGGYAIGSQAKRSIVTGVSYEIINESPLGRGRSGRVRIVVGKDKVGFIDGLVTDSRVLARLSFDATDEGHMHVEVSEGTSVAAGNRHALAVEEIFNYLVESGWQGSQRAAVKFVKKKYPDVSRDAIRDAHKKWSDHGYEEAEKVRGGKINNEGGPRTRTSGRALRPENRQKTRPEGARQDQRRTTARPARR